MSVHSLFSAKESVTRQVAMPGAVGIRKGGMEQLAKDPLNPDLGAR